MLILSWYKNKVPKQSQPMNIYLNSF